MNNHSEGCRLLAPARVATMIAGERLAPISQHAHKMDAMKGSK
jgi:hypothetical protein